MFYRYVSVVLCVVASCLSFPSFSSAQGNGNGNNGNGNQPVAGISIDASGVVRTITKRDRSKKLRQKRIESALESLSSDLKESSSLRRISLVKLEAACRQALQDQKPLPDELKYVAGINRIDYLFVYPEQKDIVIAGPAEPFVPDALGRMVGAYSGRPPLRLDDLVVALRVAEQGSEVGCSIDPAPGRLAALKQYIRANSSPASVSVAKGRYHKMAKVLGKQNVRIWGVPPDSHFAQALTEADLRMKRISMGLEKVKVRGLRSYLSMLAPNGNSMQRWWFVPYYDSILASDDDNAYQFVGQRAKLMAQEEVIGANGARSNAAVTRNSTWKFARQFTETFPDLARQEATFAELQNLIDLTVIATLLKERGLAEKVGWKKSLFLDTEQMPLDKGQVPKQTISTASYRMANSRMVIGLVGGGVVVNPRKTLRNITFKSSANSQLKQLRNNLSGQKASKTHAWWRN